jgi:hypothetical protein
MSKKVPPILVVGQSHTEALIAAQRRGEYPDVEIANLNARQRELKVADKIKSAGYLPPGNHRTLVASMIGGNFYNTFGLIENVVRFDFAEPGEGDFVLPEGRHLVTYGLIRHYFTDVMNRGFLRSIKQLKDHYAPSRFIHVCSPPPISDNEHIIAHPGGVFKDKVKLGITPSKLRRKLYDLHTRVIEEFCEAEQIDLLLPPKQAVTNDGFLAEPYWKADPTHANETYGMLVLDQLRRISKS